MDDLIERFLLEMQDENERKKLEQHCFEYGTCDQELGVFRGLREGLVSVLKP
jgi:hypothetical protein